MLKIYSPLTASFLLKLVQLTEFLKMKVWKKHIEIIKILCGGLNPEYINSQIP